MSEKKTKIEGDMTTDVKRTFEKAASRLLGATTSRPISTDVLQHSLYKFVTIYDAANLAVTQQVLSTSLAMLARGGRMELDGRSRKAIPEDRAAFEKAIQHFTPHCKSVVLREADTFMGSALEYWQALFSDSMAKLEEVV
jgi:hypothetical protein